MPSARQLLQRLRREAPPIPPEVIGVVRRIRDAGHEAWLAGGCVRDLMLLRPSEDYDVATSALPEQVSTLFDKVIPTGIAHGTVTVLPEENRERHVEVTTFRGEGEYLDGRRPSEVRFLSTVEEDLARRDFTINAMALDPLSWELRDPFCGAADLARRRVRAVGNALERFSEDGLRPLRAVRFASVLEFGLDGPTRAGICATLETFRRVAAERVREELNRILLRSPRPSRGLRLLERTGLLDAIVPEMRETVGFAQNPWHRWDVWEHTLRAVDHAVPRLEVRLAALLHDVAKPRCAEEVAPGSHTFHRHEHVGAQVAEDILYRLKYPRRVIEAVVHLVREHNWYYRPEWSDGTLRRHLARVGVASVEDFFALREADLRARGRGVRSGLANLDELRQRFDAERARAAALSVRDLAIGGAEVMEVAGVPPGPQVGELLQRLLQHVLDHPEDNTRERLLRLVSEFR